MDAERTRSTCVPKDNPLQAHAEPLHLETQRSGNRRFHVPPLEIELPRIRIKLGKVVVQLPILHIHVEARLPPGTTPNPALLASGEPGPDSGIRREVRRTPVETHVEEATVSATPLRVHARKPSQQHGSFWLERDWGDLHVRFAFAEMTARAHGCVVER